MHLAPLILDLAVILGVAALVTFLFRLIKQPVVLGYIVAGIIVGPYTPSLVSVIDVESVKVWAELGVIFLMFALGLEFSFRRLAKVGVSAGATATLQIVCMIVCGYVCARALGWSSMNGVFLGCMIAISSTTIIIKALEELGFKTKRFAELVFGILIVEDLAAILMLVALSNIASKASVSGLDLLGAAAKLLLVVGGWLVVGMFAVPRFVRAVGRRGTDEMLIVVSLGLCLALVALSAYFHYSVALGAFIMGSILAETKEVHRIETLVSPLKDIFGAVFFVSVGMLLDPSIIVSNLGAILAISAVIIVGKAVSVSLGALATGQTLPTSVATGMSMAQIGEFSFIIATLGLSYKAIDAELYPIIVAASLLTTFTTPYMIKAAPAATTFVESRIPQKWRDALGRYSQRLQSPASPGGLGRTFYSSLVRWVVNAIVVITIFVVAAAKLAPWLESALGNGDRARVVTWLLAFVASSPFVWAMLTAFGRRRAKGVAPLVSRVSTVFVVGLVSVEFFAVWITVILTVGIAAVVFAFFRRQIESYYRWFERTFVAGIGDESGDLDAVRARLVPWDAHLAKIQVPHRASLVGASLVELKLRERFGISVVVIERAGESIVAPKGTERVLPMDVLLCFGTDAGLASFAHEIELLRPEDGRSRDLSAYELRKIELRQTSTLLGRSIRDSGIQESFDCMVVGLERGHERIQSPKSDLELLAGDRVWVVGETSRLQSLQAQFSA